MGVAPKSLRDAIRLLSHPFILYAPWTGGSSLSLGLGQPWPCLDPFPLLVLLFGIAFQLQLVLLSYRPIFRRPYHFLKLVSCLGANRTKSSSVCLWLFFIFTFVSYSFAVLFSPSIPFCKPTSYNFLKLVSFLGANRTKSAFV